MDEVSQDPATTPGARLRAARKAAGMSMDDAAKAADVPKSTWQTWEAGSPPAATKAVRAARVLDTTVEAIWGEAPLSADDDHHPIPLDIQAGAGV